MLGVVEKAFSGAEWPARGPSANGDETARRLVAYFRSFGIDDAAQLVELVDGVLGRLPGAAAFPDPRLHARAAQNVADRLVTEWLFAVVGPIAEEPGDIAALGRAAFLLSDGPARWPQLFLAAGPYPEEFAAAMRAAIPVATPADGDLPMPPQPFRRAVVDLTALLARLVRPFARAAEPVDALAAAAARRRRTLVALVAGTTIGAAAALVRLLSGIDLGPLEIALAVLFTVNFAWIAVSFWTAVAGFAVALRGGDPLALRLPPLATRQGRERPRTAIVMPIYNEDTAMVFARLATVWQSVQATGEGAAFDMFVLSDSTDEARWVAEEDAWWRLVSATGAAGRIFYRRRRENTERKSGNIADFCRRWGDRYRYMVVLDADSVMTGETLVDLVDLMEAHPRTGLIQTVPSTINRQTWFGRVQQFAARLYTPVMALGSHYWQLGDGNYWGHNAIIRTAAFAENCALPKLPGREPLGGPILSHDFVEAALLRRAGWSVWTVPTMGGSYEESPPTILEFAKRDRRWCQGNLQHLRLVVAAGFRPMNRLYFLLGSLAYLSSLLWAAFLATSLLVGIRQHALMRDGATVLSPEAPLLAGGLFAVTLTMLFAPKLMAIGLALARRETAESFGGRARMVASALVETLFSILVAPVMMLFHSKFVVDIFAGRAVGWGSQQRTDDGISWRDAAARHAAHTAVGVGLTVATVAFAPVLMWWLAPVCAGLLLAIPLEQMSSRRTLGQWAWRRGLFLTPEETDPPIEVRSVAAAAAAADAAASNDERSGNQRVLADRRLHALHQALLVGQPAPHGGRVVHLPTLDPALNARGAAQVQGLLHDSAALSEAHIGRLAASEATATIAALVGRDEAWPAAANHAAEGIHAA